MTNDGDSSIVSKSTIRETTSDLANGPNVRELIFDDTDNEKPPFVLDCGCCCTKQLQCDRAFTFLLLPYSTFFAVILFCIGYLILAPANTSTSSGVLAILSASVGYLIPPQSTRQRTNALIPNHTVSYPWWGRLAVAKRNWLQRC